MIRILPDHPGRLQFHSQELPLACREEAVPQRNGMASRETGGWSVREKEEEEKS